MDIGIKSSLNNFPSALFLGFITLTMSGCGGGGGDNPTTYYQDSDGDLYGNPAVTQIATSQPAGYVSNNTDCDDASATTNPAATEIPSDSVDNNCNGTVDEVINTYYRDMDADTYGDPSDSLDAATQPAGYVLDDADCNDNNDLINPSVVEVADGIDNNCDGEVDEGFLTTTYYQDSDSDGYGNPNVTQLVVMQPVGYVLDNTDCDDSSAAINTAATEVSDDGIDNNCNGQVDEASIIRSLNDTGITIGGNFPNGTNTSCIGETVTQQDCSHGRDITHNDDSDGHAGFSYTKLDSNGNDLPASASDWSCVKDNVTGLTWEVKRGGNGIVGDEGLHDTDDNYTWYDTDTLTNGGAEGYADENGETCYGYTSGVASTYCNTEAYTSRVNASTLCGAQDWRVPSMITLHGLLNNNRIYPAIDTAYFPNTKSHFYWTSSPSSITHNSAWRISFAFGDSKYYLRYSGYAVRLVRGGL
jgi:hypothetical protein